MQEETSSEAELSTSTQTTEQDDNSTTSEVQATDEAQQTEDVNQSGQPKEETFFDPKTVPEALIPAYKQMQAAFTKKTQEIAEVRKNADSWKQKADAYAKYENFVPILEEMLSSQTQNTALPSPEMTVLEQQLKGQGYSDEAIQMMKIGADFIMKQFQQKEEAKLAQERSVQERDRIKSSIAQAETIDPRLTDDTLVYQTEEGESFTYGEMVGQIVASMPNWMQDPVKSTQLAIKKVDALIGKAKTEGKKELSQSAALKAKKYPSVNSSPQSATANDVQGWNAAVRAAKEELGMN